MDFDNLYELKKKLEEKKKELDIHDAEVEAEYKKLSETPVLLCEKEFYHTCARLTAKMVEDAALEGLDAEACMDLAAAFAVYSKQLAKTLFK